MCTAALDEFGKGLRFSSIWTLIHLAERGDVEPVVCHSKTYMPLDDRFKDAAGRLLAVRAGVFYAVDPADKHIHPITPPVSALPPCFVLAAANIPEERDETPPAGRAHRPEGGQVAANHVQIAPNVQPQNQSVTSNPPAPQNPFAFLSQNNTQPQQLHPQGAVGPQSNGILPAPPQPQPGHPLPQQPPHLFAANRAGTPTSPFTQACLQVAAHNKRCPSHTSSIPPPATHPPPSTLAW